MFNIKVWKDETRTQKIKLSSTDESGYQTVEDIKFEGAGQAGDRVTASELNRIEEGIAAQLRSDVIDFTPTFVDSNNKTIPTEHITGYYIKQGNLVYIRAEVEVGEASEGGPYSGLAYLHLPENAPTPMRLTYLNSAGYQSMSYIGGIGVLATDKRISIRRPTDSFNGSPVMASAIPNSAYIMVWGFYFCE